MNKEVVLSTHELKLLHDRDFLLTKIKIDTKVTNLLIAHQEAMKGFFSTYQKDLPNQLSYTVSKVNKGQNLKGLPYWVIDSPSAFIGENIFTYRTIIWWGNHISFHLIVKGDFLNHLKCDLSKLKGELIFYCVNDNPWEVDFEPNNLIPVNSLITNPIAGGQNKAFLKLSAKFNLERIDELTALSKNTFNLMFSSLNWLNI